MTDTWANHPEPEVPWGEPFTPDTSMVRDAYVRAMRNAFIASASEHEQEFDRWLELERHKSWQQGFAEQVAANRANVPIDERTREQQQAAVERILRAGEFQDVLDPPVPVERPQEEDDA